MLTSSEIQAFKLQSILFFYIPWPAPIKWNKDKTKLELTHPTWTWIPWIITVVGIVLYGLSCWLVIIQYWWLKPRPDFGVFHLAIFTIGGVLLNLAGFLAVFGLRAEKALISGVNGVLQLSYDLLKQTRRNPKKDFNFGKEMTGDAGVVTTVCILFCGLTPFTVAGVALYAHFDSTYFLLDELLPPDKKYWSVFTIVMKFLVRCAILLWVGVETARFGSYLIPILLMIVLYRFQYICKALILYPLEPEVFLKSYSSIQIIYRKLQTALEVVTYWVLLMTFWGSVMCVCGILKLHDRMPNSVLLAAIFVLTGITTLNFIIVPLACNLAELFRGVKDINLLRAKKRFAVGKNKLSKVLFLRTRALQTIRLRSGAFFVFGKDFQTDYFELIVRRSIEAVLSVK